MPLTETPTPTAPNATIIDSSGSYLVVEQGPAWLAAFLYAPPWWVVWSLGAVLGLVGFVTVLGATRIDDRREWAQVAAEATGNLLYVSAMGAVTYLAVNFAEFGYVVDVGIGVAGGYALASVLAPALLPRVHTAVATEVRADG